MTERLRQLLGGEADGLDVPPPATDAVLRQGRGLRRRHRVVVGACGAAAAVIVGGSVVALAGSGNETAAPDPASTPVGDNAVFSYGNHVFYDGPGNAAEIDDDAVKSLYYTSAGVVVRHGDNAYSDGGGPQRFSLVTPDGKVSRLGLVTEETVHASDPGQPYVAYAEAVDGELQVVVYDVEADAEAARVAVVATAKNWFPLSIDGDTVYVQDSYDGKAYAVDWRAGTAARSDIPTVWNVSGGRVATDVDDKPAIVDAATGDVVLTVDRTGYFNLSPDGRYAELVKGGDEPRSGPVERELYVVDSGSSFTVTGPPNDWGWTADGDLFHVGRTEVTTCSSPSGACSAEPYAKPGIPDPEPVTQTVSEPVCATEAADCFSDDWFQNCADHPEECDWEVSTYVDDQAIELRLGGRTYES